MTSPTASLRLINRSEHEVLVVDDNPASRYTTCRVLRNAGFRTAEAATGLEGLERAHPGLSAMVLDVHLPDIDGFELLQRLRANPDTARLPVVHLTASYLTDEDKVRGLDAGADAYLTHPVEPPVLVATVQALVRTRIAEDAMRRSEVKFRALYAQAPGGICLLDGQGHILDANPAMLALLGRELAAVVGQPASAFTEPDWQPRVEAATQDASPGQPVHEFPFVRPGGETVWVEWRMSLQVEPGVNMGVATDISQRALLERQRQQLLDSERVARNAAERMTRMKDDLIAVLSHELRTPLNAIMGWTHVLQKRGGTPEMLRGLAVIERNGQTQARMISDILDMSRLNLGKMPLMREQVDLAEVIQSAVSAMRPSIEEHGQRVELDLHPPYPTLVADSSRLQQVVWNLLSNAIKFSPRGSRIQVSLACEADALHLTVADEGQGVSPDFLPYLFDRFMQGDIGDKRRHGGLGLGLSIVKHLVEAHGGTVWAQSAGIGQGAAFHLRLPLQPPAADASSPPPSDSGWATLGASDSLGSVLAGVAVLVVDDDAEARTMLQIILGDRGADVRLAPDVDSALTELANWSPQVIVSDIGMPGRDGYELMREVRQREVAGGRARIPSIALTSYSRAQDRQQAMAAGFDLHCPKPLQPLQLVQFIQQLAGVH